MSISDISEFAAWEAEHRPLDEELDSQRKQRLREVRDAMDEEMVWKGQDSSNDERSEDSEGNNSEPEKLPSNSMVRRGSTEGENREKKTDVVARRMVVHALRIKIPLKTDEQRALDKALREKGMTQRQKRKDDDARVEIPSLTAPTQSDGEEDEEHPDFMAQPSSQPRPSSSPEEMGEDNDSEIIDQGEEEDPFEEFDIDPEQREFLLELLEAGVPAEEMKLLRTSTHLIVDENARTKTYFENAEKMHSNVVEFARTHPFWENKVAEELEMQEYMRDVYDYAKAAGMGKNRARVEVMRMNAAWRRDKCVDYSDRWDEDELEDVSELGMREQIVHEKEVKGLIQQTLKKLAVVEDGEVKAVQVLDLKDGKKSKKRKRAASNAVNDTDAPVRLAKRLRKELKKERRKKQRAENRMNGATGKRVSPHKGSAGPAHQMQRNKPVNTDSKPSSLATSPPKSRHERRKKIPKQGPTISAYFSQAGTSASSGVSKGGLGNMAHLADGFKPLWEGPSEMDRRRKTMEAEEKQTELKAELEELPLEATMPTNKTMASIGNVNGHTKTYPAEFNALGEDDVNRDSQKDDVSNNTAHEVDVQKKKHKRKKKRNHNRISEDQARLSLNEATNATDEKAAFSIDILESAAVCTEKDGRMNSFMDHLPQNERSIVIDTPDDHHDETKRSDRKKKKSKKDKVKKGRTRDVEHEARNASDPIAYPDSASTLKLKHEVQRKESKRKQESNAAESPPAEALTELADTNAKEPKVGRRDRGRKRKGGTPKSPPLVRDQDSTSGGPLLDCPNTPHESEPLNQTLDHPADHTSHDEIGSHRGLPSTPRPSLNVIIYTPSKTWVPLDTKGSSQPTAKKDIYKDSDVESDDNASVFSMTQYGSLDWDHSGDEFEKIEVTPKFTRRGSSVAPKDESDVTTPKTRPSSNNSSTASGKKALPKRDSKGRFAKSKTKALEAIAPEDSEVLEPHERERASVPPPTDSSPPRAKKARIIPPPRTQGTSAVSSCSQALPLTSEALENKLSKLRSKKPPSKSPYFTPLISKPRTKSRNLKVSKDEFEIIVKGEPKESSSSQPQEPKTPKKEDCEPPSKATPKRRSPANTISCIPFPPLSAPHFGLIQEKLAHDPFRLLIAVTFLIRTHGKHAIPVFYELMDTYPTPESLAAADVEDIVPIIRHLGLQNQRANTYQMYAKTWLEDPPMKGKRYAIPGYPTKASGRGFKDEILSDDDERDAWEIGHMTQGPYALDSWRIFCRDVLRGEAEGWNGEGSKKEGFQPEWMRVLPEDKELRAYLRWMWLKEGFEWDPFTGEREVASERLTRAAMEGKITWDEKGGMRILDGIADDQDMSQP